MRTYEEVRKFCLEKQNAFLANERRKSIIATANDRIALQRNIKMFESHIENIDEVTLIEIGSVTNYIIALMQRAFEKEPQKYFTDFDLFVEELVGLTKDGKRNDLKLDGFSTLYGQSQCDILGITLDDLMVFKGRDPRNYETCDLFK